MRLGLGTVQFGLSYGIANATGATPPAAVSGVLARAEQAGVFIIDTAVEYGESETVLGELLPPHHGFRIVTKPPLLDPNASARAKLDVLKRAFDASLAKLRQPRVYGLLVHGTQELAGADGDAIWKALDAFRSEGRVEKIGVSLYTGEEIDAVLSRFDPALIQAPVSVLDQRLIEHGHLAKLRHNGVEVHARSVFLQGLLLMQPHERHVYFRQFDAELGRYHAFLGEHGLSALGAALAFLKSLGDVDVALVGVTSVEQLEECLAAYEAPLPATDFSPLACRNPALLNPYLWRLH